MKQKLFISGVAGTLALVAFIVALALASSHATAPERVEVSNGASAALAVTPTAEASLPAEQTEPIVCNPERGDPTNCTYH